MTLRVRFFVGEPPDDVRCDVMLVLDVLDEVENPYALLRGLRANAKYFVFHFALDVSAYAVLRGSVGRTRESSDRLYHFTVETALGLIECCGYRVRHWRYLPRCVEDGGMSVASSLRRVPARLAWHFGRKFVSRALGKATLLVVAEAGGSGTQVQFAEIVEADLAGGRAAAQRGASCSANHLRALVLVRKPAWCTRFPASGQPTS